VRLQILAGLLDTDGTASDGGFDIVQKENLADDICFLARSLGFAAYISHVKRNVATMALLEHIIEYLFLETAVKFLFASAGKRRLLENKLKMF
jgi:hypothetical protein